MNDDWTDEEIADYKGWEAEFGKLSENSEHDEWLDWAEAEFEWGKPVPSC